MFRCYKSNPTYCVCRIALFFASRLTEIMELLAGLSFTLHACSIRL